MFRRESHQSVLAVLSFLRADKLSSCRALFGGGTRIVLDLGEYRESEDVDFLCSDPEGYAEIRFAAATGGFAALFTAEGLRELQFPREMRVDQYGIRFAVVHGARSLKIEIIREARISLDPGSRPGWSPVDCLSVPDCYAEKLLANSDRWADRQILSRDLIDLAALRARIGPIPAESWKKAELAYRSAAPDDLRKALALLLGDAGYRERCFQGLRIEDPEAILEGAALILLNFGPD
jgi:Nucleotidyl transferase AbiEii toxin, Type IV TA system